MKLLQEKLSKYDAPQVAMAAGIYPYFRMIESDQDTEVTISGKKVLMFGSNAYLGLTNHPKVRGERQSSSAFEKILEISEQIRVGHILYYHRKKMETYSVQFSCSVVSDSL